MRNAEGIQCEEAYRQKQRLFEKRLQYDLRGAHALWRIGPLSAWFAANLQLDQADPHLIGDAAALRDIGELFLPDDILNRSRLLTDAEWRRFRKHPDIGAQFLATFQSPVMQLGAQIALAHHERWDGSGYPRRHAGADIPIAARIVQVVDYAYAFVVESASLPSLRVTELQRALRSVHAHARFDPSLLRALDLLAADFTRLCD